MGKKLILAVTALFFTFMACVTVYAQYRYQANLPVVELGIARQYNEFALTVPTTAVFQDGIGDYLWLVKEDKGPWGKEYVTEKRYISIFRIDEGVAFFSGTVDKPIVIATDFFLVDNQVVRF